MKIILKIHLKESKGPLEPKGFDVHANAREEQIQKYIQVERQIQHDNENTSMKNTSTSRSKLQGKREQQKIGLRTVIGHI